MGKSWEWVGVGRLGCLGGGGRVSLKGMCGGMLWMGWVMLRK